jgi:DNA-binding CsgD family transcriptional regulator
MPGLILFSTGYHLGVSTEGPSSGAALAREKLADAVRAVRLRNLAGSLGEVARALPLAVSVETAAIRLRDSDSDGRLHVVAVEGTPPSDRLALLFSTQTMAQARSIFVLGHRHSLGRAMGVRWLHGEWLRNGAEPIGTITVGSRTERRPTDDDLAFLARTAEELGERLSAADRRTLTLEELSREVARSAVFTPDEAPERVRNALRPRELVILTLYTDGLSAQEIADLFVISTHTVRTHIKNAYRRLGVHSREEAEQIVREQRVLELV